MELICELTDKDVGEKAVEMHNTRLRLASRGIVIREDGNISYVFVGKVLEDTKQLNVTNREAAEGARVLWETPEKALELTKNCYDELVAKEQEAIYNSRFVVLRDIKILEKYIKG